MAKRTRRRNVRYSRKRNSKKRRVSKRRQRVSGRVSKKTYKRKNMRGGSGCVLPGGMVVASQSTPTSEKIETYEVNFQFNPGHDGLGFVLSHDFVISSVTPGSIEAKAGVKAGSKIIKLNDEYVSEFQKFFFDITRLAGQTIKLTLTHPEQRAAPPGGFWTAPAASQPEADVVSPKLVKKFVEDKTIHPYRELFDESGKTTELIGGILCHGSQQKVSNIDEFTFTITPVDLYLMTSDEVDLFDYATRAAIENKWNYFRKYKAGGLIQNYDLNFYTGMPGVNSYSMPGLANYIRALGGLLHFSEGVDTEQLIENLSYRDDIHDDREMFSRHEDIYFHKELLKNKVDDPNFNGEIIYKLSDIFKFIVAAKRKGEVVPDKWIGVFCRGGDEDVFPLDISFFGDCRNSELGKLPSDFFKGKVNVSDKLVTQGSLSTSNMLQNFTGVFNDIVQYISSGNTIPDIIEKYIYINYEMTLKDFLKIMKSTIEIFHPLKYKDICVILLMYNILTS